MQAAAEASAREAGQAGGRVSDQEFSAMGRTLASGLAVRKSSSTKALVRRRKASSTVADSLRRHLDHMVIFDSSTSAVQPC